MKSRILLIVGIIFLLTSCEDILTEKSFDFIQPNTISDSDEGVDLWVDGVYKNIYSTSWNILPTGRELDGDYNTGPVWKFKAVGSGDFQGEFTVEYFWTVPYTIIALANYAITGISNMNVASEAKRNSGLGELYFLKAWSYFQLVRDFGPVPIYYTTGDLSKPHSRRPVSEVYAHIIQLLKDAEDLMPKNTDAGFVAGKASAGAAASLLSKVYLTMASGAKSGVTITIKGGPAYDNTLPDSKHEKWTVAPISIQINKPISVTGYESFDPAIYFALASEKAKQVIDGAYGTYSLFLDTSTTKGWDDLWNVNNKNKGENIWSLQSTNTKTAYTTNIATYNSGQWSVNTVALNNGAVIGAYSISSPSMGCNYHWYSLFESTDIRITNGVFHSWQNGSVIGSQTGGSYYPSDLNWQTKKTAKTAPWFTLANVTSYSPNGTHTACLTKTFYRSERSTSNTDLVYPFIRLAEVYLIYAEAKNEVDGPGSDALTYLNLVRTRSSATPYTYLGGTSFDISTADDFRSIVIEERARELAFENGDRRNDLLRWGLYLDAMNSFKGIDENGLSKSRLPKHLLYPIPTLEIATNDSIKDNNPGWK